MKAYIVLDESGAMHLKNERYFVIGGFIANDLHKVTSSHKEIEKIVKLRKGIPINKKIELKSSKINASQQALFINELYSINNVIPVAVVVDKENLSKLEASENVAYNFFVKTLLKYLFSIDISLLNTNEIELRLDNRSTSVKTLKDLETFLNWEFDYLNKDFTVNYLDSKDNRDIQMADYVANAIWKKYNCKKEDLSRRINNFSKIYLSKFPYKLFNKNPSLKEKQKNTSKSIVKI